MTTTAPAINRRAVAGPLCRVPSQDGTSIAYECVGSGPPLVIVDGAFCSRAMGPGKDLAPSLAERFTVYTYDRRGRGESGDAASYAIEREVEDLWAVLEAAGGSANVFGHSSGATLALDAARRGLPIRRLALYEAPMVVDDSRPPVGDDYLERLQALISADQRGAAIKLFMTEGIRVPRPVTMIMPLMPAWRKLKAVAHTVTYDSAFVEEFLKGRPLPEDRWSTVKMPTLVLVGGKSPLWMRKAMTELATTLPNSQLRVLERQTHILKPKVTAPVLLDFFACA